jgi:citronellol/citronellal dehydrogenase
MSLCVLGMADELKLDAIAVNALWPKTLIDTAAVRNIVGGPETADRSRKPDIMADAAHAILTKPSRECTGNFFIDEDLLRQEGTTDFDRYAVTPGADLVPDFFA